MFYSQEKRTLVWDPMYHRNDWESYTFSCLNIKDKPRNPCSTVFRFRDTVETLFVLSTYLEEVRTHVLKTRRRWFDGIEILLHSSSSFSRRRCFFRSVAADYYSTDNSGVLGLQLILAVVFVQNVVSTTNVLLPPVLLVLLEFWASSSDLDMVVFVSALVLLLLQIGVYHVPVSCCSPGKTTTTTSTTRIQYSSR